MPPTQTISKEKSSTADYQSLTSISFIRTYEYACNADGLLAIYPVHSRLYYVQVMTVTMAKDQAVILIAAATFISICCGHSAI